MSLVSSRLFLDDADVPLESQAKVDDQLLRAIGIPGLAANIVNTTIGASIFVLPGTMAKMLGHAAPVAFVVCAIAQAIFVTCFAMAGSRVSLTGGLYAYVEVAFGRYVGFLAGLMVFTTNILSVAAVLTLLVNSVTALSPALGSAAAHVTLSAAVLVVLAAINVRSVRAGSGTVTFITIVKLVPLLILVGLGIFFVKPAALGVAMPNDAGSLGNAVLLLMFAFFGVESSLSISGEVRDPARTVPRAIYLAICLTTLIYLLIQFVAQGVLGPRLALNVTAPLAETAGVLLGNFGRLLLIAGAAVSSFGYVTSDILNSPRTLFAFGRDGILPKGFAHVHPRFRSPDVAVIAYTSLAFILSLTSSFEGLAVMANVAALLLYFLCCAAAWELTRRDVRTDGKPFVFRGAQIFPFVAFVVIIWMLAHATQKEFGVLAGVLVVGSLAYFLRRLFERRRLPA